MIGKDCSSFNIHDELKSLSLDEVKEIQKENSLSYAVATINVNGDLNLGSIIRTSVIFGAKKFFVIGKRRYDRRSTVGAHNYIDIEFIEENIDEKLEYILNKIEKDYTPCFIEQGGKNIKEQNFSYFNKPPCIIFGSESSGFSEKTIKYVNDNNYSMYSIKQYGVIRSLNVSAAAAITINKVADDIISSRSNNYDRGLIWL